MREGKTQRQKGKTPIGLLHFFLLPFSFCLLPGGGRLLIDRRSFDYWSADSSAGTVADWDDITVANRTTVGSFRGQPQDYMDAYSSWWRALQVRGLFGDQPKAGALLPMPRKFNLRAWVKNGFPPEQSDRIAKAGSVFDELLRVRWKPGRIAGYRVGTLLLDEEFDKQDARWTFDRGLWRWERGRLVQERTFRQMEEGTGWGGRAILEGAADPSAGPILIAGLARITGGHGYGKLGLCGGYIPGNLTSGLESLVSRSTISVSNPNTKAVDAKENVLASLEADVQFVMLIDGTRVQAKTWNPAIQNEPAEWQLSGDIPATKLGTALMLETEIWAYWEHVAVWRVQKE